MNPLIVRCDGCDENYEYKDGEDKLDGQRFCPGCVSLARDDTMSFMQRQIAFGNWLEIDTNRGTVYLPAEADICPTPEAVLQYTDSRNVDDIWGINMVQGYGARLSASGYTDCTEWSVFPTKSQAIRYLENEYGEEES